MKSKYFTRMQLKYLVEIKNKNYIDEIIFKGIVEHDHNYFYHEKHQNIFLVIFFL